MLMKEDMRRRVDTIEVLHGEAFWADREVHASLLELAAPSYEDPTALISRDVQRCDTLYLAHDASGRLMAFFMVAHEMLDLGDQQQVPTMFLGMSATRQDTKNSGKIMRLYGRCMVDALTWQQQLGQEVLLWGTTATPTIYLAARTLCRDVNPHPDGTYSPGSNSTATALRRKYYSHLPLTNDNPFVLKGVAQRTRYSTMEQNRKDRIARRKEFALFERLDIDESRGDRLLFTLRLPDQAPPALTRWHRKEFNNA